MQDKSFYRTRYFQQICVMFCSCVYGHTVLYCIVYCIVLENVWVKKVERSTFVALFVAVTLCWIEGVNDDIE